MKKILYITLIAIGASLVIAGLSSCGNRKASSAKAKAPRQFVPVTIPSTITDPESQRIYACEHFWDKIDLADSTFFAEIDTMQMLQAFMAWVGNNMNPNDGTYVAKFMDKAAKYPHSLRYFSMLAERVLYDPNSPLRSDELYIPVLEAQLSAQFYDEYERLVPQYDLELARRNRIGSRATDFRFTMGSGRTSSLYAVKADYTLVYINNPGCPMCRDIQQAIEHSPLLSEMIADARLTVLAIYPDRDLAEWRKHPLPSEWINGYDEGCVIEQQRLYDLRAIPSLYLLDKDKRVLVKDSSSVAEIEYALSGAVR